jgi:AAA+ ATPase superfamily predicted ATPase
MKFHSIANNSSFIGRTFEISRLKKICTAKEVAIVVVYGKRRVGKTELIEQFFRGDRVLKFEGIQTDFSKRKAAQRYQIAACLHRLASYMENPLIDRVGCSSWTEFFELLDPVIREQKVVLYLEEIQWLSAYQPNLLAELKPFWDDRWRHQKGFVLVICGSSPSFILNQIIGDKALYSRSINDFHIRPFSLIEAKSFFKKAGNREVMQAYLTIGGVPEYLKAIRTSSSLYNGICEHAFTPDSLFLTEAQRIFISSMSDNRLYRSTLDFLSKNRYANRKQIQAAMGAESGGTLTAVLDDLERCDFIERYSPLQSNEASHLCRYAICDEYLNFFYRLILPLSKKIKSGRYIKDPGSALSASALSIFLGFSFERWCRRNSELFARIMGFDRIEYSSGAFYNRRSQEVEEGFQIDLMYVRADHKIVICEMKYLGMAIDAGTVYRSLERKKDLVVATSPRYKNYTFEYALITTEGVKNLDSQNEYFDHIITFDQIFDQRFW